MKIAWRVMGLMVVFLLLLGMAGLSVVSILPERRVCFQDKGCVLVAMAKTDREQQRGLGGVRWLPDTLGMLFVFDDADLHPFWMKGMRVPLDFVWLKREVPPSPGGFGEAGYRTAPGEARVVEVTENVFPEKVGGERWTIYKPMVPVDMVLEVPAGWVARRGLVVGDALLW